MAADCAGEGCTATATCSSGKRVIYGMIRSNAVSPDTCDTDPGTCNAYCTVGATSCSATDGATGTGASVYIVCGKIA